jgi:hypothetical protein
MLVFDHLAVAAATLAEGVAWVEDALGVALSGGGAHPHMGTHNRLLGLGDLYLEVIAIDPDAPPPVWPRWFDLDNFAGPPRLTNWVARCDDLSVEVARSPAAVGVPVALKRGDYAWEMAVPGDGKLPYNGGFPALIQWHGSLHPAQTLPDMGMRLRQLEIAHPEAVGLRTALMGRLTDPRVVIIEGPLAMQASFDTPHGLRILA